MRAPETKNRFDAAMVLYGIISEAEWQRIVDSLEPLGVDAYEAKTADGWSLDAKLWMLISTYRKYQNGEVRPPWRCLPTPKDQAKLLRKTIAKTKALRDACYDSSSSGLNYIDPDTEALKFPPLHDHAAALDVLLAEQQRRHDELMKMDRRSHSRRELHYDLLRELVLLWQQITRCDIKGPREPLRQFLRAGAGPVLPKAQTTVSALDVFIEHYR
jgi:hypothetical protein